MARLAGRVATLFLLVACGGREDLALFRRRHPPPQCALSRGLVREHHDHQLGSWRLVPDPEVMTGHTSHVNDCCDPVFIRREEGRGVTGLREAVGPAERHDYGGQSMRLRRSFRDSEGRAMLEKCSPQSSEAGHSAVSSQWRSCSSVNSTTSPWSTCSSALRSSASCVGETRDSPAFRVLLRGAEALIDRRQG